MCHVQQCVIQRVTFWLSSVVHFCAWWQSSGINKGVQDLFSKQPGQKPHTYLFGCHFIILSDHKPLRHLFKSDSATPALASARLQHWTLLLGGYEYSIEHRPGEQHSNADFRSCLPLPEFPANAPDVPETVFLMEALESSQTTAAEIKQ